MLKALAGKKTYALAIGFTAYAIIAWWMGDLDANRAIEIINVNGLGVFLRAGVAKVA